MKKTLRITFAVVFCCFAALGAARSQGIENYKYKLLQADPATGARAEVTESGDAAEIIRSVRVPLSERKVNGYRVRIFFDNKQTARQSAAAAQARFKEMYPDIPAYMVYENPYFKVTVGNFLSIEEAVMLWGHIKNVFETAFITREEITLSVLGE